MLVTLTSMLTGAMHSREINVDALALLAYMDGTDLRPIQQVFPHLKAEDTEFLMTGITPDEWATLMAEEHDTPH